MKEITDFGDEYLETKKEKINRIIALFKLNKETLLTDQYNNCELFKKIKELAISKGGFIDNNTRKKLWDFLFYKIKNRNKKSIIDIIKIDEEIKLFITKLSIADKKKELTESKLMNNKDYKIILKDLPRTCKNIIKNKNDIKENKTTNISPEIFMFACEKFQYQYLQGLLNIIFYFRQVFNYEDCINALNIFFEFFYKDLIDLKLSQEHKEGNIHLISEIITDLYKYLYPEKAESDIMNYIPVLSNKWIISSFLSEINDINKGFRILDYLIVSEPYIKYVLATVLINKFNETIETKFTLNSKLDSLENSFENIFEELKAEDLNILDLDEIINETQNLIDKKGKDIKNILIEKFGNNFKYSFNLKNQGLISYYNNLVKICNVPEPKREFKLNLGNPKYYKYFFVVLSFSYVIYYFYKIIDDSRVLW